MQEATVPPRELRERDRHVRRAERRDAEGARFLAEERGSDGTCQHAAGLALVAAGADRRVSLDVLDRGQPGTQRATDVGHGRVPFQVDERRVLVAGAIPGGREAVRQPVAGRCSHDLDVPQLAVRDVGADPVVEPEAAAGLRPESEVRVPAAGQQQEVRLRAVDSFATAQVDDLDQLRPRGLEHRG